MQQLTTRIPAINTSERKTRATGVWLDFTPAQIPQYREEMIQLTIESPMSGSAESFGIIEIAAESSAGRTRKTQNSIVLVLIRMAIGLIQDCSEQ